MSFPQRESKGVTVLFGCCYFQDLNSFTSAVYPNKMSYSVVSMTNITNVNATNLVEAAFIFPLLSDSAWPVTIALERIILYSGCSFPITYFEAK